MRLIFKYNDQLDNIKLFIFISPFFPATQTFKYYIGVIMILEP